MQQSSFQHPLPQQPPSQFPFQHHSIQQPSPQQPPFQSNPFQPSPSPVQPTPSPVEPVHSPIQHRSPTAFPPPGLVHPSQLGTPSPPPPNQAQLVRRSVSHQQPSSLHNPVVQESLHSNSRRFVSSPLAQHSHKRPLSPEYTNQPPPQRRKFTPIPASDDQEIPVLSYPLHVPHHRASPSPSHSPSPTHLPPPIPSPSPARFGSQLVEDQPQISQPESSTPEQWSGMSIFYFNIARYSI